MEPFHEVQLPANRVTLHLILLNLITRLMETRF